MTTNGTENEIIFEDKTPVTKKTIWERKLLDLSLKQLLQVTDGNLTTHLKALENSGYISSCKQFIGRKPNTSFSITDAGRCSFSAHINALSKLLNF